jgi:hypothetical protein
MQVLFVMAGRCGIYVGVVIVGESPEVDGAWGRGAGGVCLHGWAEQICFLGSNADALCVLWCIVCVKA